jgi:hypothetical protein
MTAMTRATSLLNAFKAPAHRYDIPKLQLRRRSDEHPMAMFGAIVSVAFISMALLPNEAPAYAPATASMIAGHADEQSTDMMARLPTSQKEEACKGQVWGGESEECLIVISREAGKDGRRIRMVMADQIDTSTPNVF